MDKLKKLLMRCKCVVFITVNEHRDYYNTAAQSIEEARLHECPPEIDADVEKIMVDTNTIVCLQFYPDTPIGSYEIWHYDIDAALDKALDILEKI